MIERIALNELQRCKCAPVVYQVINENDKKSQSKEYNITQYYNKISRSSHLNANKVLPIY